VDEFASIERSEPIYSQQVFLQASPTATHIRELLTLPNRRIHIKKAGTINQIIVL